MSKETEGNKTFDLARAEAAIHELLLAMGEDPTRDGLKATPGRVARAYAETCGGLFVDPEEELTTTFEENHKELILVKNIPVSSLCEHHLFPILGVAHVGYIPGDDGRVTGLSKISRVVELFARRPQVQERLTTQIAQAIQNKLNPRGVIVIVDAEHLCVSTRGVRMSGVSTVTTAFHGLYAESAEARAEAISYMKSWK